MISKIRNQADYLREANALTVTLAMIETRTALDNLEAIAGTDGIDGLFLGPSDLSIALSNGVTLDPLSKEVDAQLERITAAALKAGKIMGAFCQNAQQAVTLSKRGLRFLAIGSDLTLPARRHRRRGRDAERRSRYLKVMCRAHRAIDQIALDGLSGLAVEIAGDRFEPAILCQHFAQQIALLGRHLVDHSPGAIALAHRVLAVAGRAGNKQVDAGLNPYRAFLLARGRGG